MNKKIISVLMAAAMLTPSMAAMAEEAVVISSENEAVVETTINTYNGVVTQVKGNLVTVTIDGKTYSFAYDKADEFAKDDEVVIKSESLLETKDIKEAVEITKAAHTDEGEDEGFYNTYNTYNGVVKAVTDTTVTVTIDGFDYNFRTTSETAVLDTKGEAATEVKANDAVTVVSTSLLETKDIKAADALIVGELETTVYASVFTKDGEGLISEDGELIVNVENADELDGKSLVVFYSIATASIPAQTNPDAVVVLGETEASEDDNAEVVIPEAPVLSYNNYVGNVKAIENGVITLTIGEADYNFRMMESTKTFNIDGEEAEAKAGDFVIVVSSSLLDTKDVKEAEVVVVSTEETATAVCLNKFNKNGDALVSADGELVLNIEGDIAQYDGKKLLVFYNFATMSIPAQTNPEKVIVMPDDSVSISFCVGDIVLNINGDKVELETAPYIAGTGVTLVPLRVISEAFGAEVNWDGETKTVTVAYNGTEIKVVIGSTTATVDGDEAFELEAAPELSATGNTMVPLRFISEKLGAAVGYDEATAGITVEKN